MSPGHSAHEQEAQRFAQEVAGFLNQSVAAGEFEHLILFAAPHFLGLLRDKLSNKSTSAVIHAEAKNLTQLDVEEIKAYLA